MNDLLSLKSEKNNFFLKNKFYNSFSLERWCLLGAEVTKNLEFLLFIERHRMMMLFFTLTYELDLTSLMIYVASYKKNKNFISFWQKYSPQFKHSVFHKYKTWNLVLPKCVKIELLIFSLLELSKNQSLMYVMHLLRLG